MTDIEQKALAMVNEVRSETGFALSDSFSRDDYPINEVLCRAIEQREAAEQENEQLRRDHAAAVKEANIAKARLKGVTKQWHADRADLQAQSK